MVRHMLKDKGFEILIASPAGYNQLVAEIYFDGKFAAQITQEGGAYEFEMPGPFLKEDLITRKVDWQRFKAVVESACQQLAARKSS